MGYAMMVGPCIGCGHIFGFNPMRVPSVRVNGVREPICLACVTLANEKRKELGLEPFVIKPDAYEACDENELN